MRKCRKGHEYRGDENYRARRGWCPVCFREVQARYDRTTKGRTRAQTYEQSDKGGERSDRYKQSPQGWQQALRDRRAHVLARRAIRVIHEEAEDSSGTLQTED